jgi:hypothetical protein
MQASCECSRVVQSMSRALGFTEAAPQAYTFNDLTDTAEQEHVIR